MSADTSQYLEDHFDLHDKSSKLLVTIWTAWVHMISAFNVGITKRATKGTFMILVPIS